MLEEERGEQGTERGDHQTEDGVKDVTNLALALKGSRKDLQVAEDRAASFSSSVTTGEEPYQDKAELRDESREGRRSSSRCTEAEGDSTGGRKRRAMREHFLGDVEEQLARREKEARRRLLAAWQAHYALRNAGRRCGSYRVPPELCYVFDAGPESMDE